MAQNHNKTALFAGYELRESKDVRFLAVAMNVYLQGLGNSLKLRALSEERCATITRVAIQMVIDVPLATAIQDLVAADRSSDDEMTTHGQILQKLVYIGAPAVRPAIKPVPTDPLPQNLVGKNPPGARGIKDPALDMDCAKRGTPDKSKYKFQIDFETPNPYMKGVWDYCSTKHYDWLRDHPEPSWETTPGLSKFNQWRSQIFKRCFGPSRSPRDHWSVNEKNLILDLMKKDLKNSHVVRWKRLANNFNRLMQGQIQGADEIMISQLIGKSRTLGEDRLAPWRTLGAIKAQTSRWEEAIKMEEEARAGETSAVESTDDEKELSGPESDSEKIDSWTRKHQETKSKGKGEAQRQGAGKSEPAVKSKAVVGKSKVTDKRKVDDVTDNDEKVLTRPASKLRRKM